MREKLLPCPFCGGAPNDVPEDNGLHVYWIICDNVKDRCGCEGPYQPTPEDAVAAWNRRTLSHGIKGVDNQVLVAASQMDQHQKSQPEWLWFEEGYSISFGRWPRSGNKAPYIRADLATEGSK